MSRSKIQANRPQILYLAPSGNFEAPYFHRANAFISALSIDSFSQVIEIGPPRCLKDLFPPVRRLSSPQRIKIVSPFWVNVPWITQIDNYIFAMVRAMFLNLWVGAVARLFLCGRNFKSLLFYSPQFAFFHLFFYQRDMVIAYDKADPYSLFYTGPVQKAIALLDGYNTAQADVVLAPSPQLEILAKKQGAKRTVEVDNGIYSNDFVPRSQRDKTLAVYVGNLVQDMWGVDVFLEATVLVVRQIPTFHAVIVGEGPLKEKYLSMSKRMGIFGCTKFEGFVPHDRIGDMLCTARVAVAPYKQFQGFRFASRSLKISEYLASGTPVVVTNVGPFADLVRDEGLGIVVDPTPKGIADGIASILLLSDKEWNDMSQRAMSKARDYDWKVMISKAFNMIDHTWAGKQRVSQTSD